MTDVYTPLLRFVQQAQGSNINQWGVIFNSGVTDLLEQAIAGVTNVDMTLGDVTLTSLNGTQDQSRSMALRLIGDPGGVLTVTLPSRQKLYVITNQTSPGANVLIKTATSSPITLVPGATVLAYVDGATNNVRVFGGGLAVRQDTSWTLFPLNVSGGGFAVTARWMKVGDLVTVQVPAFSAAFTGGAMNLSPETQVPGIQRPATTPDIPACFPVTVIDGGSVVPAFARVASGTWLLEIVPADGAFESAATRALPSNLTFTYAVTDD